MPMTNMIPLTNVLKLPDTTHILYFFENDDLYLKNLLSYINTGIERGHQIIVIENHSIYCEVEKRILDTLSKEEQKCIHYVDNHTFYHSYNDFHIDSILDNFGELVGSMSCKNANVRTWAHVEWDDKDDFISKLVDFEQLADCSVNGMGVMSVCAYAASEVSAYLQTALMRSHRYYMTDIELVKSSLYKNN